MTTSSTHCWTRRFSHVYVEDGAADYPMTARILERLPDATVIPIDDYRDVFNRPRQYHSIQRRAPKLILAMRPSEFVYRGSDNCQDYGYDNFHYATPMLNCTYNCDYCYLQAAHPSAHVVVFVNVPDFLAAAENQIDARDDQSQPLYLSIAYSNDVLALEDLTGICRQWIEYARDRNDLIMEIRTKSTAFDAIADLPPTDSVILSWSISSDHVHRNYESQTPSPINRLRAAKSAMDAGWKVRLCLDPVIPEDDWKSDYGHLIDGIFDEIAPANLLDVAAGAFRMGRDHFDTIRKQRPDCGIFWSNNIDRTATTVTVREDLRQAVMAFIADRLSQQIDTNKVALWE